MPATLDQLVGVRSQLAKGLLEYFDWVARAPDRQETLPAYMDGRTRTELYVEPDVFKRKQQRRRDAPEAQENDEEVLYGEVERPDEERVSWAEERKELKHGSRSAVLAPPGYGKSLLTQMTARSLAIEAREALESQRLGAGGVVLPIVLGLNPLTSHAVNSGEAPEDWLRRAIAATLRQTGCPGVACGCLADHAHEAHTWLFLDAMDEADDGEGLARVFGAVKPWECRVVITSRPYGFEARHLAFDVTEYRLAPFEPEQVETFIGKWSDWDGAERPARREERRGPGKAHIGSLLEASPSIQQMSRDPFLLTLVCWVAQRGELQAEMTRAEIYDRVIRDLLGLPLIRTGDVDAHDVDELRAVEWLPLVSEMAFTFFKDSAGGRPMPSGRLLGIIKRSEDRPVPLDGYGHRMKTLAGVSPRQQAVYLLDELCRKRLLVPLGPRRALHVFPHRSLHEFLAGVHLGSHEAEWGILARVVGDAQWSEALLAAIGSLGDKPGEDRAAERCAFINFLCRINDPPKAVFAGAEIAAAGLLELRDPEETLRRTVADRLRQVIHPDQPQYLDASVPRIRASAGRLLNGLPGGDTRQGVGVKDGLPDILWCDVPGGTLLMGSARDETDAEENEYGPDGKPFPVEIEPFLLAAYPITNAQFRPFVEGDGYTRHEYWTREGWEWKERERRQEPYYWQDAKWNRDNHPVVGVTWYEAVAYCRWLTRRLRKKRELSQRQAVRLPTEAEWEWAARGPSRHKYPWGMDWRGGACNSDESGIGQTCAVGLFPSGVSACLAEAGERAYDLAGNLWEWCGSPYANPYDGSEQEGADAPGNRRVLRGGSWNLARRACRCAYRHRYGPGDWDDGNGFRVVVIPRTS